MEKQNLYPILSSVKYNKIEKQKSSASGKRIGKQSNASNSEIGHSKTKFDKHVKREDSTIRPRSADCKVKIDKFGIQKRPISSTNDVTGVTSLDTTLVDANPLLTEESDTVIEGLFQKNQVLHARWSIMEQRIENLKKENRGLHDLLNEERSRCTKYQKKLQYIQDNQPVFDKLKQAYMTLKYNEQKSRSFIEIREKGCQTYRPNLVKKSIEITERRPSTPYYNVFTFDDEDDEITFPLEPGYMPIRKKTFVSVKKTVQNLKKMVISQPLSTFVISENKEAKYRKDIADLFMENRNLKQLVIDQQIELDASKEQLSLRRSSKETSMMKKIIAKLDREIRKCEKCKQKLSSEKTLLSEIEKKLVEHISSKYELKLQLKREDSNSQSPKLSKPGTPYFTPRTGQRETGEIIKSCDDNVSMDSV